MSHDTGKELVFRPILFDERQQYELAFNTVYASPSGQHNLPTLRDLAEKSLQAALSLDAFTLE